MKRIAFALLAALLIAGQLFSPAVAAPAAAASNAPATASTCGDTYVVQRGDYLTWIARYCNVTYSQILAWNPNIGNPNYIYPGQVIRLIPGSTVPVTSGGTYVVRQGDTLFKIAVRYGTTVSALLAVNTNITNPSRIYTGQVINLPGGTTTTPDPGTTTGTTARVTVSSLSVARGGTVTVTASGFPANTELDFRVGKQGAAYTSIIDGKTNASGSASATVTIPSTAVVNEKWVIVVMTTELAKGTTVTSAPIIVR
jgi:LysM repeat protein